MKLALASIGSNRCTRNRKHNSGILHWFFPYFDHMTKYKLWAPKKHIKTGLVHRAQGLRENPNIAKFYRLSENKASWKWMVNVGRRSFPSGARLPDQVWSVSFREGRLCELFKWSFFLLKTGHGSATSDRSQWILVFWNSWWRRFFGWTIEMSIMGGVGSQAVWIMNDVHSDKLT